jgi:YidC/Oxa1 family membrane protein insertase
MTSLVSPLLGENSLFADIGKIFHPLFEFFGLIVSGIYSVTGNYGLSIIGLTVLIMLALTPVTVKSTKSMIAMQRLQPEMKKLQTKYKGPENRELLNQEMMKLYKENGTSPFGACLPSLLQMPFLIVLYSLIRGLSNTVKNGATYVNGMGHTVVCHTTSIYGCAAPRYIPTTGKMYNNLVLNHGQMHWWFGMDLSSTPFTTHTFPGSASQAVLMIPYLVLIGAAIFLQYYQMKQMNSRNPGAAQANPQMQTMQKFFPIIFGFIYLRVPAGATIYMVFSSAMRIATQEVMFRTGMVSPVGAEREIGGGAKGAKGTQEALPEETGPKPAGKGGAKPTGKSTTAPKNPGGTNGTNGNGNGRRPTTGKRPASGKGSSGSRARTNGRAGGNGSADDAKTPAPKPHPRSRSKKERKAR